MPSMWPKPPINNVCHNIQSARAVVYCCIVSVKCHIMKAVQCMIDNIQNELDSIVGAIADTGLATKIILFGSFAKGDGKPGSDIDICVLTHIADRRPIDIAIDLRRALFNSIKMPLDLLTYNQDLFYEHAAKPSSFASIINTEGVVIYER